MSGYLDAVAAGIVIFDGGTGTTFQRADLTPDDFGGPDLEGCNELLNVTRPDLVTALHRSFLEVGADVVETNTFGAFSVPLDEYGIADRSYELSAAGAALAREAADRASTADHPRFVAGSMGPGTKFASLGQVPFRSLRDAYETQAEGLIDGGVDLLIIETQFDLLGVKAAAIGAKRAMRRAGRDLPLQIQVTIELAGRMLPGTEIGAALTTLDALGADIVGVNCATGPEEMYEPLRFLSAHSRRPISCIPNAGLPRIVDGAMEYDLDANTLATHLSTFVTELGVSVVGGCCGTTPAHIAAVVAHCRPLRPARPDPKHDPSAASMYQQVALQQDTSFLIIGERTNANGSKAFREAMLAGDLDGCVEIGQSQVEESAHLVDLCVDYVGRDGVADMGALAGRFATEITAPVVLDSTEPEVMEAGLEQLGGRCVLNSANLEDGDAPGSRVDRVFRLAAEHGAAVICLLIDEDGQARDAEWKLRVAHRLHDLATQRYGLASSDLLIDPLTFPLSTGEVDLRRDAMETIDALGRIEAELPGVFTVLGISNVSFGLSPPARRALNSVFLHECLEAGLDAAIVHAGRILPLHQIDPEHRQLCLDLIYDRRRDDYDPLTGLLAAFAEVPSAASEDDDRRDWPVEQRLHQRIVDGAKRGLDDELREALDGGATPLDIINDVLLGGMREVGERFAAGDMQLPFVLRSAETMKAAVGYLEPLMEQTTTAGRGSIVLATVQGDVHDIGKNLVDIILTNNGYEVHNLGIKVGIGELIDAFERVEADAIGMSGLLVKSTLVMRDNLDELNRRGLGGTPVLLGGAALTRSFVERDLRSRYPGPVYYGKDAFAGLDAMRRIVAGDAPPAARPPVPAPAQAASGPVATSAPSSAVARDHPVPRPPFLGTRIVRGIPLDDISAYINRTALFRNQWQFRPDAGEDDTAFKERMAPELRRQLAKARADALLVPQVVYGYFPANSDGDELVIWTDIERTVERRRFRFPRQEQEPGLCIADFFRPLDSPDIDYAAFHIVSMGPRVSEATAALFSEHRYRDYLLLHGLGVEMTEALAEYWHLRIREEWGFADEDGPTISGLFRQQYRGGRYSWGYPACPDLEDNETVASLLGAERLGISVGADTGYQYQPEQTTSALICHHPEAKYFIARKPRAARR